MHLRSWFRDARDDVRYATRVFARNASFTTLMVVTLALGVGSTTAVFSAVNTLILRPLPFARPAELMKVSLVSPSVGGISANDQMAWPYPRFAFFREIQQTFAEIAVFDEVQHILIKGDRGTNIVGEEVGATYFRTLGISPFRGRDFDRSIDEYAGAAREVIVSYDFWRRELGEALSGTSVTLDGNRFAVIGVAPPGFHGLTGRAELFVPVTTRTAPELNRAGRYEFSVVARRKPAVTAAAAAAQTKQLGARINEAFPEAATGDAAWGAKAIPLDDARVAPVIRQALLILLGAVSLVLLIACVNVANLQLARAAGRSAEIGIRLATGATRARIARQLITESLALSLFGATAGLAVAWLGTRTLAAVNAGTTFGGRQFGAINPIGFTAIRLDPAALAFTLAIAIVAGVAFGLAPALQASRTSLSLTMKGAAAPAGGVVSHMFTGRRVLVLSEVAIAIVLLVGSGLFIRSLRRLLAINPGFSYENVLTLRLTIPADGPGVDSLPGFYEGLVARVRAVSGVTDAAMSSCVPLTGSCGLTLAQFPGTAPKSVFEMPLVVTPVASPTLFSLMRIPLRRGRFFTDADRAGTAKVLVINETAARKLWPSEDALGKRLILRSGGFDDGAEVVGIVGDVRLWADSLPRAMVYISSLQRPNERATIFVRSTRDVASLTTDLRRAIAEVAPRFPIDAVRPLGSIVSESTARTRFGVWVLTSFAAAALGLALVGIYGVITMMVAARNRELAVRIALGAQVGRVRRLIVMDSLALVGIGVGAGLGAAVASARLLGSFLYDIAPLDPPTLIVVVIVVVATALAASWLPAVRASRVDPARALRAE